MPKTQALGSDCLTVPDLAKRHAAGSGCAGCDWSTVCVATVLRVWYEAFLYTPETGHALHTLTQDVWDGPGNAAKPDAASLDDDGDVSSVEYALLLRGGRQRPLIMLCCPCFCFLGCVWRSEHRDTILRSVLSKHIKKLKR